ncbi:probable aspartic protease At2g35615 [Tripterygium wilfordii]|uniref:probable aspartic protease At2g35615 n=1 Tax=Tripterygium wilfordii TaxID=458696 RepID=UPI0018F80FAF|nr:probable aspartic protease At2g35615 [Tripterygium wilfordii]
MYRLIYIVILILFSFSIRFQIEGKVNDDFSIDLIHSDSLLSQRSRNQAKFFNSSMDDDDKSFVTSLGPRGGTYLMKFYIGTPSVKVLAIPDTGNEKEIGDSNRCIYNQTYGDKSYSIGVLSNETFYLKSNANIKVPFSELVFGCGHDNHLQSTNPLIQGIVGLGVGPLSLVSQIGSDQFSYCLLPVTSKASNKLKFGVGAKIPPTNKLLSTQFTLENHHSHYCLTLESISIGNEKVRTEQSQGNIIIDSGTTLTRLDSSMYEKLTAKLIEVTGKMPIEDPPEPLTFCYEANSISINDLPEMTFGFSGGDLALKLINTYYEYLRKMICLTIVPTTHEQIFGSMAQINFQVEYDVQHKRISFGSADCT